MGADLGCGSYLWTMLRERLSWDLSVANTPSAGGGREGKQGVQHMGYAPSILHDALTVQCMGNDTYTIMYVYATVCWEMFTNQL